ncbi:hypothetical protein Hanom_Chr10g00947711 [Helianthus anomalus]
MFLLVLSLLQHPHILLHHQHNLYSTSNFSLTRFLSSFITFKSFFWSINTSSPFQTHQSNFFFTMAFKVGHSKRKCASLVKQQRGRIYILRRCATMLLCWYIHGDD